MLSNFLKRLLFARQFSMNQGKVEILGVKQSCIPIDILSELQEKHGTDISKIIHSSIKDQMKKYAKAIGVKPEGLFKSASDIFDIYGIGRLEIDDFDPKKKKAIAKVHDSPLRCKKQCSITSSVLSGMFSFMLGKEVKSEINKCLAKGDKYCEFIIK